MTSLWFYVDYHVDFMVAMLNVLENSKIAQNQQEIDQKHWKCI